LSLKEVKKAAVPDRVVKEEMTVVKGTVRRPGAQRKGNSALEPPPPGNASPLRLSGQKRLFLVTHQGAMLVSSWLLPKSSQRVA